MLAAQRTRTGPYRAFGLVSGVFALRWTGPRGFVDAATPFGLAVLIAELPRLDLWGGVRARICAIDWSAPGLNVPHFWLAAMASRDSAGSGYKPKPPSHAGPSWLPRVLPSTL